MTGYNDPINYNSSINYNGTSTPSNIVGGHFLPEHHKHKRTLSNVNVIYKKAQLLSRKETKELRDAISEFIEPALAMQATLPEIIKIDYASLEANDLAYQKFSKALSNIEECLEMMEKDRINLMKKQIQEDDELLLLSTIACLIH